QILHAQDSPNDTIADNTVIYSQIPMPDGDSLSAVIVINKKQAEAPPAVLMYSIYASEKDLIRASIAANAGYAGIVVNTRGKNKSKSAVAPFKHDAEDAWYVLDWISKQPWCNGTIGMYGGSYLGFSQWAAVKKMHPALKTIVPQAAVGPGIDFPAHNGVSSTYSLLWLKYVSDSKFIAQNMGGYWTSSGNKVYRYGYAFNTIDSLDSNKMTIFKEWMDNPTYSEYWQNMVPYGKEFAHITIPVLSTTGYYDADQAGSLYYLREHYKYNRNAEHYLIIGPYDHFGAQGMQGESVLDYKISPAANVNFTRIAFKWFDYVLKGKEKPAELKDRINYQVMGTDEWRHAPSLESLDSSMLTLYLSDKKRGKAFSLELQEPLISTTIPLVIDLKNRKSESGSRMANAKVVRKKFKDSQGLAFISEPFTENKVIAGCFNGELLVTINKRDMDILLELYEILPDGTYHNLSHYLARASLIGNRSQRKLFTPGVISSLR
ncbi:MAG: CocE/NonD family hydrolase, partial [Sphingobacteriales bacterium]